MVRLLTFSCPFLLIYLTVLVSLLCSRFVEFPGFSQDLYNFIFSLHVSIDMTIVQCYGFFLIKPGTKINTGNMMQGRLV